MSALLRESKRSYLKKYFKKINDLKSAWNSIKTLFIFKKSPSIASSIGKFQEIANAFNKYFVNVASDSQSSIKKL